MYGEILSSVRDAHLSHRGAQCLGTGLKVGGCLCHQGTASPGYKLTGNLHEMWPPCRGVMANMGDIQHRSGSQQVFTVMNNTTVTLSHCQGLTNQKLIDILQDNQNY